MKKRNKIIISLIIGLFFILINSKSIYGRISSTDIKNAEPGSIVTVTLSTNANIDSAHIKLVDKGGLIFIGSKSLIANGKANGELVGFMTMSGEKFTGALASFTFKIPEGYNKKYTVKFEADEDYSYGIDNYATITTKAEPQSKPSTPATPTTPSKPNTPSGGSETINKENVNKSNKVAVEKAPTNDNNKSSNNYLKGISTNLGTLSPSFNRSQSSYTLSFPYDFDYKTLDKIVINASKEDDKQKIAGTGSKEVKVGSNVYNIVVTAENGETRTYTIKLIKPEISEDKNIRLATMKLTYIDENGNTIELPFDKNFNPETFEYALNVDNNVKSINVASTLPEGSDGIKVSVEGNQDLQDGENVITVTLVNENADIENPKKTIYTIKINKAPAASAETAIAEVNNKNSEKKVDIKLVIGIILGVVFLLILILIILLIVNKKQSKKKESEEYGFIDENEEYDDDNDYDQEDYNAIDQDADDMNLNTNSNFENNFISDDGFVKKEDIEKAEFLGGYDSKILNTDFEENPKLDQEITSSLEENNKKRNQKGKRYL